jgi:hypothetical protein
MSAIALTGSKSQIVAGDKSWDEKPVRFDVSLIQKEFGFEFTASTEIRNHLEYWARAIA